MVVVDSSALIPLAWVGRLDLLSATFEAGRTTEEVREEVLVGGKRGTAALDASLEEVEIHPTPSRAAAVSSMEGIAVADASVILTAGSHEERLLANDKGLMTVAESHGVPCWWVTTLLLRCVADATVTGPEGADVLYDLVDAGLNLHPRVYARVDRRLRALGENG